MGNKLTSLREPRSALPPLKVHVTANTRAAMAIIRRMPGVLVNRTTTWQYHGSIERHAMNDIFLSYASPDRERVVPLVNALESQGFDVWWDRDIAHGDNYHRVIERALQDARCVIVIWSEKSIGSEWVVNEASDARRRGVLLPALLDEVEPPLEFRHLQAARLVHWAGSATDEELQKLALAVRGIMNRSVPAPHSEVPANRRPRTAGKSLWETPAGWALGAGALFAGVTFLVLVLRFGAGSTTEAPASPAGTGTAGVETAAQSSPSVDVSPANRNATPTSTGRLNLLDSTEGAKIVGASESGWKDSIFRDRRPQCAAISSGGFVIFAFKDERRARFDRLGIFVESTDRYNAKTVEIYASDATDQGPFMKVATFEVPNFRNERQPFHELSFEAVAARYVKLVVTEFRTGRDMPNGNVCTMELYGSLL